jgi:hypothetical protein
MKRTLLLFVLIVAPVASLSAQTVQHPDKGSPERTAVLNSLRPIVEQELKQKVTFVINSINLQGGWVFVDGRLRTLEGRVPDWKNTSYAQAAKYGAQSDGISAVLKRTNGHWRVIVKAIGCTDVCYVDWWKRYKAPKAIFPYTE